MIPESESKFSLIDRITPELRNRAKRIESLNIGNLKKVELALLLIDEMKATEISVFEWNDNPEIIKQILEECGFVVEVEENITQDQLNNLTGVLYIAKDTEILAQFKVLDTTRDHELYGRMMGYPDTAIRAFGNEDAMLSDELQDMYTSPVRPFRYSNSGKETEIEKTKEWENYIKSIMPTVYNELMQT